jgi:type IV secretory pathway VirB6-like protein
MVYFHTKPPNFDIFSYQTPKFWYILEALGALGWNILIYVMTFWYTYFVVICFIF